jgi:hypothetical protein
VPLSELWLVVTTGTYAAALPTTRHTLLMLDEVSHYSPMVPVRRVLLPPTTRHTLTSESVAAYSLSLTHCLSTCRSCNSCWTTFTSTLRRPFARWLPPPSQSDSPAQPDQDKPVMELGSSHGYAIFTVVAITVIREGIESVIFLAGRFRCAEQVLYSSTVQQHSQVQWANHTCTVPQNSCSSCSQRPMAIASQTSHQSA